MRLRYDCKDPDAPPVPDPYYPDAAWYLEAIRAPSEARVGGYDGSGVQILINDDGVDNTHPDLAKLDVANSCGVYAPCAKANGPNAGVIDSHGTNCAAIAAADSNSACGVGVAPGAGIASCVMLGECSPPQVRTPSRTTYNVNDISSNSLGHRPVRVHRRRTTIVDGLPVRVSLGELRRLPVRRVRWRRLGVGGPLLGLRGCCRGLLHQLFQRRRDALFGARPLLRQVRLRPDLELRARSSSSTARQTVEAAWARCTCSRLATSTPWAMT